MVHCTTFLATTWAEPPSGQNVPLGSVAISTVNVVELGVDAIVQEPSTAVVPVDPRGMLTGTPLWKLWAAAVVKVATPSAVAPLAVVNAELAGLSSPWKPMATTL